jgi:hypothetical protein
MLGGGRTFVGGVTSVSATDTFNRPDAVLGAFPQGGYTWQAIRGTMPSIRSNVLSISGKGAGGITSDPIIGVDLGVADGRIEGQLSIYSALYFRIVDASNWWRWWMERETTGTAQLTLQKCVANVLTTSYTDTFAVATPVSTKVEFIGNQIKPYRYVTDVAPLTTISDAAHQTADIHGLGAEEEGSPNYNAYTIDDWSFVSL